MNTNNKDTHWLDGRTAVVTAASRGLGFAAAKGLLTHGANVILIGRDQSRLNTCLSTLETEYMHRASPLVGDLNNLGLIEEVADFIKQKNIPEVSIAVLSSPHPVAIKVENLSVTDMDETLHLHVSMMAHHMHKLADRMAQNNGGRILLISSPFALIANPDSILQSVAKAALLHYMRSLAIHKASSAVAISALMPGYIDSPLVWELAQRTNDPVLSIHSWIESIPAKHLGSIEAFQDFVALLCADYCQYMTGNVINYDGGFILNGAMQSQ